MGDCSPKIDHHPDNYMPSIDNRCSARVAANVLMAANAWIPAYSAGKQIAAQLATQLRCVPQDHLATCTKCGAKNVIRSPIANIIMDTTYFRRDFGVMVLIDRIQSTCSARW